LRMGTAQQHNTTQHNTNGSKTIQLWDMLLW
jgi:hypothetical protein